jgi:hypothetical protein
MEVGGQLHAPAALPTGMTRYPLYKRLGRSQGWSGRVLKISPPPEFDPRTIQLVASRYTDWAIAAHSSTNTKNFSGVVMRHTLRPQYKGTTCWQRKRWPWNEPLIWVYLVSPAMNLNSWYNEYSKY